MKNSQPIDIKKQNFQLNSKKDTQKMKKQIQNSNINQQSSQNNIKKSKTLICCVCGRQFGTNSLKIHYPQCCQRFKNQQFIRCKNQKERRKPPQMIEQELHLINKLCLTDQQIQSFNKTMNQRYRQQSLLSCINCNRKFTFDSLQKHQKNCVLIYGNLNPQGNLKRTQSQKILSFYQKTAKKPKTLICYICGRQFGLTSLIIHQKSCFSKFKNQQKSKPTKQRKKIPQLPEEISKQNFQLQAASEWNQIKINKYNQIVNQIYNTQSLNQCYVCLRTFLDGSLPKHLVHCQNNLQKIKFKKSLSETQKQLLLRCDSTNKLKIQKAKAEEALIKKPRVLMCHICGRQFGLTSLQIHLKICADKFLKQQELKDKKERKTLPELPNQLKDKTNFNIKQSQKWEAQKISEYNRLVAIVYYQKSLSKCYICLRSFFEQSLPKHLKHCQSIAHKLSMSKNKQLNKNQQEMVNKFNQRKMTQSASNFKIKNQIPLSPKTLTCHICGRQFGLSSLSIHLPQCELKFFNLQYQKQIKDRKKLPNLEDQLNCNQYDIKQAFQWNQSKLTCYNLAAQKIYKNCSLFKCEYCQRSFLQQQLAKHKGYCQRQTLKSLSKSSKLSQQKKTLLKKCKSAEENDFIGGIIKTNQKIAKNKALTCHICGRQYGSSSLHIHLPKCRSKFQLIQQKKPIQDRKIVPQLGQQLRNGQYNLKQVNEWSYEMINYYNQSAQHIYKKESLSSCQYCKRSFFHQQLPKHLKFCQKQYTRKKQKQNKNVQFVYFQNNKQCELQKFQSKCTSVNLAEQNNQNQLQKHLMSIMSIVQEQQVQNSLSSITASPTKQLNQNLQSSLQLIPQKQKTWNSLRKNQDQQQKRVFFNNYLQNPDDLCKINPHQNLSNQISAFKTKCFYQQTKTDKSLKIQEQTILGQFNDEKGKVELTFSFQDLNIFVRNQNFVKSEQKKECVHCNKKIKWELIQRHLQMCKFNQKMTGYKKTVVNSAK